MTDTLPRTIPTDPTEQEAQMPQWVKVEACRLWNNAIRGHTSYPDPYSTKDISRDRFAGLFSHALTIWQWCPEPVDLDLLMAREVCADRYPDRAKRYLSGELDYSPPIKDCLAMAKRVREAKQ